MFLLRMKMFFNGAKKEKNRSMDNSMSNKKPKFEKKTELANSDLLSRLQDFLPKIREANTKLDTKGKEQDLVTEIEPLNQCNEIILPSHHKQSHHTPTEFLIAPHNDDFNTNNENSGSLPAVEMTICVGIFDVQQDAKLLNVQKHQNNDNNIINNNKNLFQDVPLVTSSALASDSHHNQIFIETISSSDVNDGSSHSDSSDSGCN